MGWAFVAVAYLLGSIPCGMVVAKLHGVDLRAAGSGNTGATNALRVIGKTAGVITLLGDMAKGVLAVWLALRFGGREFGCIAAGAAVIGHDFPVLTGFKGGKGVATSFGVVLMLEPLTGIAGLVLWILTVIAWRYSSLGALVSFVAMPMVVVATKGGDMALLLVSVFLMLMIILRHRSNITRLINGDEPKVGRKTARNSNVTYDNS